MTSASLLYLKLRFSTHTNICTHAQTYTHTHLQGPLFCRGALRCCHSSSRGCDLSSTGGWITAPGLRATSCTGGLRYMHVLCTRVSAVCYTQSRTHTHHTHTQSHIYTHVLCSNLSDALVLTLDGHMLDRHMKCVSVLTHTSAHAHTDTHAHAHAKMHT